MIGTMVVDAVCLYLIAGAVVACGTVLAFARGLHVLSFQRLLINFFALWWLTWPWHLATVYRVCHKDSAS